MRLFERTGLLVGVAAYIFIGAAAYSFVGMMLGTFPFMILSFDMPWLAQSLKAIGWFDVWVAAWAIYGAVKGFDFRWSNR